MKNVNRIRAGFVVLSIAIAFIAIAAWVFTWNQRETSLTNNSGKMVLSHVKSSLETIAPVVKRSTMDLWWVTSDGYSIINDSSPAIEARFPGCESDLADLSNWKSNALKIINSVDSIMATEGFEIDTETNSSKSLSDTKFYDYIKAYFRGSTKAVLVISPDCGSTSQGDNPVMYYSATFGYTNEYQRNYELQYPYLKDLKLKDAIVHIQKSDGEFKLLAVNYRRTGHALIVKRGDGKWKDIWSGQDLIACDMRDGNKIPISIAPDCYNP